MDYTKNNGALAQDYPPKDTSIDYLQFMQEQKAAPKVKPLDNKNEFIFADEKMLRIKEIVEQIADANVPVLITGESGTGKEVIARMIHRSSARKDEPFVGVNCAALPSNLLESELFGFEKGAFTGATQRHLGKFEQATNGTLLLDEVTETNGALQAKLLRALQEKEIERIGGNGPVKVNTRIIATTNRDIAHTVSEGQFRQDLFYRLYVIQLEIPALRQRPKDIEVLTRHFLRSFGQQYKNKNMTISADAMAKLVKYSWPGNVRELQNLIQRAILMSKGEMITSYDFNLENRKPNDNMDWVRHLPIGRKMREVEVHFIIETLKDHNGNRTHSAKTLGISLRTLRNKINEFVHEGYDVPQPTSGKPL
ncbi:MAG: sigma-54-dependent Fis family transcriptional regulator [Zetaproteobacteria bacterium]|nr:sigma-54-dependent Fis family transcriptional regulator [Pseudobdellovibrionaceae bacterium]